jgi:hypothetical protein
MLSSRLVMVPLLSSAARMPFLRATIFIAIEFSSADAMNSVPYIPVRKRVLIEFTSEPTNQQWN